MANELDSLQPNTQTPGISKLGTSSNSWDEIFAKAVYVSGAKVPGVYIETVDLTGGVAATITHSLGTQSPIVQVYGSGAGGVPLLLPVGSGVPAGETALITYVASGVSTSAIHVTAASGIAGAKVVVLG